MLPDKYDRVEIGRRIKRLRNLQEMSVQELAKRSKVSAGYISEVERGMPAISVDKLTQIAEGLGTGVDTLLCEPNDVVQDQGVIRIPAALSLAAEQKSLSHSETLQLLRGRHSLRAKRSQSEETEWTVNEWLEFYDQVKDYLGD